MFYLRRKARTSNKYFKIMFFSNFLALSLVVSDLLSETQGSWFQFDCQLCAKLSSLQQSPGYCVSVCEVGGSGSEELKEIASPLPAVLRMMSVRELKPIQKKVVFSSYRDSISRTIAKLHLLFWYDTIKQQHQVYNYSNL